MASLQPPLVGRGELFVVACDAVEPVVIAAQKTSATAHRELVVGVDPARYGVLYWSAMPQPDQEVHAIVGTKLVFK